MTPQIWIIERMRMYKIFDKVMNFNTEVIKKGKGI